MTGGPGIDAYLLAAVSAAFALLLVVEKQRPYQKFSLAILKQSFSTNVSAFLLNNIVMSVLSVSSLIIIAENYSRYGVLSGLSDGPLKWAASFVLLDLAVYLWHVLGHKSERLWRFHKIHHSDKSLNVTTGLRFHIFDQFLEVIFKCACVIAIGTEAHVVFVCELVRMLFVFFHHANVSIPGEKWLSRVIITPSLHRLHHSTLRSEHDSNYGIVLAIWDTVFGTRKEAIPERIGLEIIEAENFAQLFSLAFLTERRFASLLHLLPRYETYRAKNVRSDADAGSPSPAHSEKAASESL